MSKNNCLFHLKCLERKYDDTHKDRFISFLVPVDPDEPEGLNTKEEIIKLEGTNPEEILSFIRMFNTKVDGLEIAEGRIRFRLFERLFGDDVKQERSTIKENLTTDQEADQDCFVQCMIDFILRFISHEIALDTKEWISELKKPRDWSVQKFLARIKQTNNLF